MAISRSRQNTAARRVWSCRISILGRAPNGCAVSTGWKKINPACGNQLAITTAAIRGKNSDIGMINNTVIVRSVFCDEAISSMARGLLRRRGVYTEPVEVLLLAMTLEF